MAISLDNRATFDALKDAFAKNMVCLVEGEDSETGETIDLICAIFPGTGKDEGFVFFTPLGEIHRCDPTTPRAKRFRIKDVDARLQDVEAKETGA